MSQSRTFLSWLLALGMVPTLVLNGCSSVKDSYEEMAEEDVDSSSDSASADSSEATTDSEASWDAQAENDSEDSSQEAASEELREVDEGAGESSDEAVADNSSESSSEQAGEEQSSFDDPANSDQSAEAAQVEESAQSDEFVQADQSNDGYVAFDKTKVWIPAKKVSLPSQVTLGVHPAGGELPLNAVYYVRKGDSWASIAKLLYGEGAETDRAPLLKKWNKSKALSAGAAVLYNSGMRPSDTSRVVQFIEDFRQEYQSYQVQKSDSLSAIAKRYYGDVRSWRELSAINPEIDSPDQLSVGQVIRVSPASVDTGAVINQFAQELNQVPAQPAAEQVAQTEQPVQADPIVQAEQPVVAEAQPAAPVVEVPPPAAARTSQKKGVAGVIEKVKSIPKHFLLLGLAGLVALIGLGAFLRQRKSSAYSRSSGGYTSSDDVTKVSNQ